MTAFRFIHTADWHLGQSFYGHERDFEHGRFLDWLRETLIAKKPHALLISGDVFDTVNPSATAQRRFYDFLARVHAASPDLQIVVTAGNHDAAARLEAPAELFRSLNISAIGTVARDSDGAIRYGKFLVPLKGSDGGIAAIAVAVPFLRPSDVPEVPDANDAYLDGMRALYNEAVAAACKLREAKYPGAVLIAMAHCHLQGAEESRDSERRLIIGGEEALGEDVFPAELAYVALGHLHRPQRFQGGRIQYSGSPIPLSFSEKDYSHRVVEVSVEPGKPAVCEGLQIPKSASLLRVPAKGAATLDEVLRLLRELPDEGTVPPDERPFVEVRVLEDGPDPTRRTQIEQAIAGRAARLAVFKLDRPELAASAEALDGNGDLSLASLASLDPLEMLESAHLERFGMALDAELLDAFREIIAEEARGRSE